MKLIKKIMLMVAAVTFRAFNLTPIKPAQAASVTTPTMGVIGDSIPAGWTGTVYNLNQTYPDFLRRDLGLTADQLVNYSVPHGRIVGNRYADCSQGKHIGQDMRNQILQHKTTIAHLKTLFVALGINDYTNYSGSGSITNISQTLARYLRYIHRLNPTIHLYGILPLVGYSIHDNSFDRTPNDRHFTLKQLRTKLAQTYAQAGAIVINPNRAHIVTDKNHFTTLADRHIHPTVATNKALAHYIAQIIKPTH